MGRLAGLDGRAVLHQVRGSVETAALPVVILTGTGSDEIEAELLEAGADDYVEKSVDADRLHGPSARDASAGDVQSLHYF